MKEKEVVFLSKVINALPHLDDAIRYLDCLAAQDSQDTLSYPPVLAGIESETS